MYVVALAHAVSSAGLRRPARGAVAPRVANLCLTKSLRVRRRREPVPNRGAASSAVTAYRLPTSWCIVPELDSGIGLVPNHIQGCPMTAPGEESLSQGHARPRHRCHQCAKHGVDGFSTFENLSDVRVQKYGQRPFWYPISKPIRLRNGIVKAVFRPRLIGPRLPGFMWRRFLHSPAALASLHPGR
jgi:hypothetical protein